MNNRDILIIGGGPGGYTAAIRAAQLGKRVTLFEKDALGGTCLNKGCIPTKALLASADLYEQMGRARAFGIRADAQPDFATAAKAKDRIVKRSRAGVESLLASHRVEVIIAEASLTAAQTVTARGETYCAPQIIMATGSVPSKPPITGINYAITSDEALALDRLPKRILLIGGGVIGCEFAQLFHAFGVHVTLIEAMKRILPSMDSDISAALQKSFSARGIHIRTEAMVREIQTEGDGFCVSYSQDGVIQSWQGDLVLCAVGRTPLMPPGTQELFHHPPCTDAQQRTVIPWLYSIGDVNGRLQLAHSAMAEGTVAAEAAAGLSSSMAGRAIPYCVYTSPEIGCIGITGQQAQEQGMDVDIHTVGLAANGRACAMRQREGLVKMIAGRDGTLLGLHIIGPSATELISTTGPMLQCGLRVQDIAQSVFPHPTIGEAVWEAARGLYLRQQC